MRSSDEGLNFFATIAGAKNRAKASILQTVGKIKKCIENWRKSADKNSGESAYEDLAAKDSLDDKNKEYLRALKWAVNLDNDPNVNITNLALTGPYGSGKSTIIKAFKKEYNLKNNCLDVSLASFEEQKTTQEQQSLIEKSILQQIFYTETANNLRYSRFKRISNLDNKTIRSRAFWITAWAMSLILFTQKQIIKDTFFFASLEGYVFFILFVASIVGAYKIISMLISAFANSKFTKMNLKGELELDNNANDSSVLNKYIDEILYFFEVTPYKIVIFQDLDRFQNSEIFSKLREINILLNNSKQINKRIVFIYAIKDDMFLDKNRTKFFDFIIPVIPIVHNSNSKEIFKRKFKTYIDAKTITGEFLSKIALYVDDMRMLINIANEFEIYKTQLEDKIDKEKLLAMIVYKNIYPADFADLHEGKGFVYSIFEAKPKIIADLQLKGKFESLIQEKTKELKTANTIHLQNIEELRRIYVSVVFEKYSSNGLVYLDNSGFNMSQLLSNNDFTKLLNCGHISKQRVYSIGDRVSFNIIENEVDGANTYVEREKALKRKLDSSTEVVKEEIKNIRHKLDDLSILSIKDINEQHQENLIKIMKDKKIDDKPLLVFLLRNGYIDEQYYTYISYFYEGSLSKSDNKFLLSVANREHPIFDFLISNEENVLKELNAKDMRSSSVLNYHLVNFISDEKNQAIDKLDYIVEQIADKDKIAIEFMDKYFFERQPSIFLEDRYILAKKIIKQWSAFWSFIINNDYFSESRKADYFRLIALNAQNEEIKKFNVDFALTNYIEEKSDFLDFLPYKSDKDKIDNLLALLNPKFKYLKVTENSNKELLKQIYEKNLYRVNEEMIKVIIESFDENGVDILGLKTANYTTIKLSSCESLAKYIDDDLEKYIENVFLLVVKNTRESLENITLLLNNTSLPLEIRTQIIEKIDFSLPDIADIGDFELQTKIVESSKMKPVWSNALSYFQKCDSEINEALTIFLNNQLNYLTLSTQDLAASTELADGIATKFSLWVLNNNQIKTLALNSIIRSIPNKYTLGDKDIISESKILIFIKNDKLLLTPETYDALKSYKKDFHIELVTKNIKTFLENIKNYNIDDNDLLSVLKSMIAIDDKLAIIEKIDVEIIHSFEVANEIYDICIKSKPDGKVNFELVKKLILLGSNNENKISFINDQFSSFTEDEIYILLNLLGEPYSLIVRDRLDDEEIIFNGSNFNAELVKKLKRNNIIASYTSRADSIHINLMPILTINAEMADSSNIS